MDSDHRLVKERKDKLKELQSWGIETYPYTYDKKDNTADILKKFEGLEKEEHTGKKVSIAGRIVGLRNMGKAGFFHVQDFSGKVQVYVKKDELGEDFKVFNKLDLGDVVGIKGEVFCTRTGEITINASSVVLLTKSLRPFPEKYHGLKDVELRYRKRYLDLIMNPESKKTFRERSEIVQELRLFLIKKGYLEVETPSLHVLYGGAEAKPFVTHHNELNTDLFLRISPELYLKRLLVGGFEKIFEINKNFRNEGIDTTHNPEFTMIEFYECYIDYTTIMEMVEQLYSDIAKKVLGTTKVVFKGKEIELKAPWKRISMLDCIKEHAKIDAGKMTDKELLAFCEKNHVEHKGKSWGYLVQALFEHFCEEKLEQPTFVVDHPVETTPLCKPHRTDKRLVERVEAFCMGMELCNGYSELNDSAVQRKLLENQQKRKEAGDEEANPLDEDFLEAIEYGMPPAGGVGIGIDRMIMLLCGKESIRDVILFPTMKPE